MVVKGKSAGNGASGAGAQTTTSRTATSEMNSVIDQSHIDSAPDRLSPVMNRSVCLGSVVIFRGEAETVDFSCPNRCTKGLKPLAPYDPLTADLRFRAKRRQSLSFEIANDDRQALRFARGFAESFCLISGIYGTGFRGPCPIAPVFLSNPCMGLVRATGDRASKDSHAPLKNRG